MELIKLIKSLSPKELERLSRFLLPVLETRRDYLHFVQVEVVNDLNILREIGDARTPLLQSEAPEDKAKLAELDRQLVAARQVIAGIPKDGWAVGGHQNKIDALQKARKKATKGFASY